MWIVALLAAGVAILLYISSAGDLKRRDEEFARQFEEMRRQIAALQELIPSTAERQLLDELVAEREEAKRHSRQFDDG